MVRATGGGRGRDAGPKAARQDRALRQVPEHETTKRIPGRISRRIGSHATTLGCWLTQHEGTVAIGGCGRHYPRPIARSRGPIPTTMVTIAIAAKHRARIRFRSTRMRARRLDTLSGTCQSARNSSAVKRRSMNLLGGFRDIPFLDTSGGEDGIYTRE